MRDAFFLLIFPALLYFCFKKPFIGVTLWLWVALFYPKGWVYGFASGIRYNLIIVAATILSYIMIKNKPQTKWDGLSWLILLFLFWTFITSVFTISVPDIVWTEWIEFLKICLLYFFAIAIIRTETHINVLLWGVVFSLGFYSVVEGLKYISSGGGHVLNGLSGHVLGDRNDLAVAIIMMIPLVAYLSSITEQKYLRAGLLLVILMAVVCVLGSNSRGGFVGLAVLAAYFWFHSRHKFVYLLVVPVIVYFGLEFMPQSWHERMATLENADQDLSFLGRIMAWKQAVLMAMDNITGGGFKAGQSNLIWFRYDPQHNLNWLFDTSTVYFDGAKAAHSIYFQVLGDHGFIGLLMFLLILFVAFSQARLVAKRLKKQQGMDNLAKLSSMLRVSLFAYAVAGAAVSLAYFDLLFAIFAITHVMNRISLEHRAQHAIRVQPVARKAVHDHRHHA
jgi:probable O-glycosylation ligase (exosortase A-associated)